MSTTLANLHRPTSSAALASSIRSLAAEGLKPRDIAAHFSVHIGVVLRALEGETAHDRDCGSRQGGACSCYAEAQGA